MIRFENVSFSYEPGRPVLEHIDLTVNRGDSVGIIGANGTGKSTLMRLLLGLMPCTGRITVDSLPVERKNLAAIRRKVGYVLQESDHQMFMPTVYEDMIFGPLNYGADPAETEARIDRILDQLGITDLKHRQNHKLSGGEKRMAAIAAILAMEPEVLVLDEPSIALDPWNRRAVIRAVNSLNLTKLIVSHDLDLILETCSRAVLLSGGRVAANGPADVILRNRSLLESCRLELPLRLQS